MELYFRWTGEAALLRARFVWGVGGAAGAPRPGADIPGRIPCRFLSTVPYTS